MNRKEMELRLKVLQKEISNAQEDVKLAQKRFNSLQTEASKLTLSLMTPNKNIGISDHAILRYIERKFKLNIDDIRNEILTPERYSAIKAGATKIKTEYVDFIIKDNTIVTSI